ncbi:MAG: type VII toxin-antitoxin system HepT family RNase toxin [bacterium]
MINYDILDRLLCKLRGSLKRLYKLRELNKEYYLGSDDDRALAEYHLRISIEAVMDIGNYIIASEGWERPEEYRDIPVILGKHGVIPRDFADKIASMVGFRNVLVHLYLDIDHERVYEMLQNDLGDFEEYVGYAIKFVRSPK